MVKVCFCLGRAGGRNEQVPPQNEKKRGDHIGRVGGEHNYKSQTMASRNSWRDAWAG